MQGSDQDSERFEVFTDATFDTTVWSDPTAPLTALDAWDVELFGSLWIEDEFGEAALEALVEDYCRAVLTVEEITAYRAAAGIGELAPALPLPVRTAPASRAFHSTRCAA